MATITNSNESILIAHLADTHLRDTQYATARRGVDFYDAFKRAVELACDKADVLVLVGDIFDRARPSPKVIKQLMEIDRYLSSRGKICFAVTGNHDWSSPTWLETLFSPRDGGGIYPIDDQSCPTFWGFTFAGVLPHSVGHFRDHLAEVTVRARGADVVLYHGLVDGVVPFFIHMKDPLHVDEFPIDQANKAWLLGDIHVQGYTTRPRPGGGDTLIGYPGSTEMCSASEPTEKSIPIIRLTKEKAELVERIPIPIRPFIRAEVVTAEDLDNLMRDVEKVADQHPVVVVKFNRALVQTINRLHSVLDAQRATIRCYPLPETKVFEQRTTDDDGAEEELDMQHFVARRFEHDSRLQRVALDLLVRGETDTEGIIQGFIESSLAAGAIREDEA